MKRFVRMSYSLNVKMPLYPGTVPTEVSAVKSIGNGDSCNTSMIMMSNHAGTHIDGPAHFDNMGKNIADYAIESFIFMKPFILDCKKLDRMQIMPVDLADFDAKDADMLLIRTGFGRYRKAVVEDRENDIYCSRNPYLHSETAYMLRERYPELRAIGIDCISIACVSERDIGRETHRILLSSDCRYPGDPVLIIEDMFIPDTIGQLSKVIVAPLYFNAIDSAPCTVIGVLGD